MKTIDKVILPVALALIISVAGIIARMTVRADAPAKPQGIALPIVMYHHILKDEARLNQYTISPAEFSGDLQFLKDSGYTPVVMRDLIAFVQEGTPLPEKPVMITFDDGYESFHEYAYPILQEFGFQAVYSVVGKYVDQYSETDDHHIRYSHCTWNQLIEMQKSGLVEIQNHSYNLHENKNGRHGSMIKQGENPSIYGKILTEDLRKLQEECEERLGAAPTTFTYPFGRISPQALPIIKELGFSGALTCEEKINYLTGEPEQLYHLRRFNRPHGQSFQSILQKAK